MKKHSALLATLMLALLMMGLTAFAADSAPLGSLKVREFAMPGCTFFAIEDASGSMKDSLFPEIAKSPEKMKLMPGGSTPSSVNVFVLKMENSIMLIDAGWGTDGPTHGNMLDLLKSLNITPENVDKILLTHMHPDHISGLLAAGKAVFPKAELIISNPEYAYWVTQAKGNEQGVALAKKVAEAYNGRISLVDFGSTIVPGITAIDTAGHTPGHTAYLMSVGSQKIMIMGDIIHASPLQFKYPEVSSIYDVDPKKAAETRASILERATEENLLLAFMHVPFPGMGTVKKLSTGGFEFTPIP